MAGRNWARIVLTVLAMFDLVNFLTAVAQSGAALELIWSLAGVSFTVVSVLYQFRPESTAYFIARRRPR